MNSQPLPPPPAELIELAVGYQRSKTLFAIVEFEIPTLLENKSLTVEQVARLIRVHPLATDRLLNAGVALNLFVRDADAYRNTELSATHLVQGRQSYLGDQLKLHDATSYRSWSDLTKRLREWQPGATDAETPQEADQGAESMRAQHNLALLVGNKLAESFDFSGYEHLLDLGGGSGAMSISIARRYESLRATVYELPEVATVAREFIEASKLADRIAIKTGDFKQDELKQNFDVALLANLLSVSSAETNRKLFKRIYELLPPNGAIILCGWMLDEERTSPLVPVLFCLEDINWGVPDVERSAQTYTGWLAEVGFIEVEQRVFHHPWSMVIGRKH